MMIKSATRVALITKNKKMSYQDDVPPSPSSAALESKALDSEDKQLQAREGELGTSDEGAETKKKSQDHQDDDVIAPSPSSAALESKTLDSEDKQLQAREGELGTSDEGAETKKKSQDHQDDDAIAALESKALDSEDNQLQAREGEYVKLGTSDEVLESSPQRIF
jgi:hypothetical protein